MELHQKIEVQDSKFNSFCICLFNLTAKTAAVNSNPGIEMALIGDMRGLPIKRNTPRCYFHQLIADTSKLHMKHLRNCIFQDFLIF